MNKITGFFKSKFGGKSADGAASQHETDAFKAAYRQVIQLRRKEDGPLLQVIAIKPMGTNESIRYHGFAFLSKKAENCCVCDIIILRYENINADQSSLGETPNVGPVDGEEVDHQLSSTEFPAATLESLNESTASCQKLLRVKVDAQVNNLGCQYAGNGVLLFFEEKTDTKKIIQFYVIPPHLNTSLYLNENAVFPCWPETNIRTFATSARGRSVDLFLALNVTHRSGHSSAAMTHITIRRTQNDYQVKHGPQASLNFLFDRAITVLGVGEDEHAQVLVDYRAAGNDPATKRADLVRWDQASTPQIFAIVYQAAQNEFLQSALAIGNSVLFVKGSATLKKLFLFHLPHTTKDKINIEELSVSELLTNDGDIKMSLLDQVDGFRIVKLSTRKSAMLLSFATDADGSVRYDGATPRFEVDDAIMKALPKKSEEARVSVVVLPRPISLRTPVAALSNMSHLSGWVFVLAMSGVRGVDDCKLHGEKQTPLPFQLMLSHQTDCADRQLVQLPTGCQAFIEWSKDGRAFLWSSSLGGICS